jgi:3-dehydroquinate synthetase
MLQAMMLDKKTSHGKLNLILPTRIGHVQTVKDVPNKPIEQVLL